MLAYASHIGDCGSARITACKARRQVVDFHLGGRAEIGRGLSLRVGGENGVPHHHIFARGQADALSLLIADQGKNRNAAQLALLLESPGRRNLFQSGPVLVLQHHAEGVVGDDPADDVRRHNDAKRRPVVFNDEGNVRPDHFDLLRVVVDDLIVRGIMRSTLAASMLPRRGTAWAPLERRPYAQQE